MSVRDHRDRGAHSSLAIALERAIVLQRLHCSFIAQSPPVMQGTARGIVL